MDVDDTRHLDDESDTGLSSKEDASVDDFTLEAPSFAGVDETNVADTAIVDAAKSMQIFDQSVLPLRFGDYELVEKIGEGGVGVVFRAIPRNKEVSERWEEVALKVIRPSIMGNSRVIRRFAKESRILASIESPHVTRFIEFGKESGVFFIATEFVRGATLSSVVSQTKDLPAKVSLRIIADLLRAVHEIHTAGAIHRDIKPGNVIVAFTDEEHNVENFSTAKLTDFGLARQVNQSESMDMTRQRAMMGTPLFMAPEQFADSRSVDERADIYSVGITLYQLITGEVPFEAKDAMSLGELHRNETPRPPSAVRSGVGQAIDHVVQKALEKNPASRYQSAAEMLGDIEHILNDLPIRVHSYPQLPDHADGAAKDFVFEWELNVAPKQLWPLVADTDRFNRAIGLPAPEFTFDHNGQQRKIFAAANFNGMKVRWREHPFQWNSGRELSVLREFEKGPFEWVTSTVELNALSGNRTRVVHKFRVLPRGMFGRLLTRIQFGLMTRRDLDKAYQKMESIARDESCGYACDFSFGGQPKFSKQQQALLNERLEVLIRKTGDRRIAEMFADYLQRVDDPFVARIRPVVLSQRFGCSFDKALKLCFNAIESSLINLYWDIICPVCRVSSGKVSTLEKIEDHAKCEACNQRFEVDFAKSVEAVFSVHPEVRNVDQKVYCIGGPFHAPHIVSQNYLCPNEKVEFEANLVPGRYDAISPQLETAPMVSVSEGEHRSRVEFALGEGIAANVDPVSPGDVFVGIDNRSKQEVQVRLEQRADIGLAFTAAQAFQHPLFSELMPKDLLSSEQLVQQSTSYLLSIRLNNADEIADEKGDVFLRDSWKLIEELAQQSNASSLQADCSESCMVVPFEKVPDLLTLLDAVLRDARTAAMVEHYCFTVTCGNVMANSGSDSPVFGKAVRRARKLGAACSAGDLLLQEVVWNDLVEKILERNFVPSGEPVIDGEETFYRYQRVSSR